MKYVNRIIKKNLPPKPTNRKFCSIKAKLSQEDTEATESFFTDRDFTKNISGLVNFEIIEFIFDE